MAEYNYMDKNGHNVTITKPIGFDEPIICAACGLEMWRKPQSFRVNWGGLKPSDAERRPGFIQDAITHERENRERYQEDKESNGN
jgi:hypothetical protein